MKSRLIIFLQVFDCQTLVLSFFHEKYLESSECGVVIFQKQARKNIISTFNGWNLMKHE